MDQASNYDPEARATDPKYSMPDGSYPINNCADVSDAAKLAHHSKTYSFATVKAMVLKAKKGLGCPDSVLPATWDESGKNSANPDPTRLIRSSFGPNVIELRDSTEMPGSGSELHGHFSTFNKWYEVNDVWEGQFLERVAPGAFAKTIEQDQSRMRVLFDHGFDPTFGDKPLGPITTLEEDDTGAHYVVPLLDTAQNRDFLLPALQGKLMDGRAVGSQLGASFQFIVHSDTWDRSGKILSSNPKGLPRRTITEAKVFEFGPVTFPASPSATAGVRSDTADFYDHLLHDGRFVAALQRRIGPNVTDKLLEHARQVEPQSTRDAAGESREKRQLHRRATNVSVLRERAKAILQRETSE